MCKGTQIYLILKNFCNINFVIGKISVAFHVDFGRCRGATMAVGLNKENRHAQFYAWRALIKTIL